MYSFFITKKASQFAVGLFCDENPPAMGAWGAPLA